MVKINNCMWGKQRSVGLDQSLQISKEIYQSIAHILHV